MENEAETVRPTSVLTGLDVYRALRAADLTPAREARLVDLLDEVYFEGPEERRRLRRFAALIVLSTMIAAFGLLADSVAVVIGAMLVAPLMTPILGVAVSVVLTEPSRLLRSAWTVLGGAVGAIAVGFGISFLASGGITATNLPGEVLGRTAPGLLDLGIAVAAGLAAGYLLVDRAASAGAAGVAIAVALVPPLAVVGICFEVGAWSLGLGALLLFGTNLAAIVLSASVVVLASGLLPRRFIDTRLSHLGRGLAVATVAVLAITVPLAAHTLRVIEQERFERQVAGAIEDWDSRSVLTRLESSAGDPWTVRVAVASGTARSPAWRLAELISDRTGRAVDLEVSFVTEEQERASTR